MGQRIELDRVVLGEGTACTRGSGHYVEDKHCAIWIENGWLWIKPRQSKEPLRFYHPAHCEMYPKPGQESVPSPPEDPEEKKLAAVGGMKK